MISDFVPYGNLADKDWTNPDCLRCQWHPENNRFFSTGKPAFGKGDVSVCASPGMVCGKYSPPWKPEVRARNLGALQTFLEKAE